MSTKIYDAYEFKGALPQLMQCLLEMRTKVIRQAIKSTAANTTLNRETCGKSSMRFDLALKLDKALSSHEHFLYDDKHGWLVPNLYSSAVVYPVGKRLFVQFFSLPRDIVKDKRFVDYHYQNQTDPWYYDEEWRHRKKTGRSKGKTWLKKQAANYRERRRIWGRIFRGHDVPTQVGLAHDFVCSADTMEIALQIFERIHGHKFMGKEPEKAKACELCNAAKQEQLDEKKS